MTGLELVGLGLIALSVKIMKSVKQASPTTTNSTAPKTTHSERLESHGGLEGYITYLYNLFHSQQVQSELAKWDTARIKQEILKTASALKLPKQVLYGIISHESRLKPVGIYGDNIQKAVAANSTAFGVGQLVSKTFDVISPYVDFDHLDMWRPDRGVLASAMLLRILYDKYQDTKTVLQKYAGTWQGGQNLLAYIQAKAGEVA